MKIVTKEELRDIFDKQTSDGAKTAFAEYTPCMILSDVMIREYPDFGATNVVPRSNWESDDEGTTETFSWDWSITDYEDTDKFAVFDVPEILQMIRTLVRALPDDLLSYIKAKED